MTEMQKNIIRCDWANQSNLEQEYHDREWGRPLHDDAKLFELLMLEGMQAGLSWSIILKKREHMRDAFDGFIPEKIVLYNDEKIQSLLMDAGIIRNRRKIAAVMQNARAYLRMRDAGETLDDFLWRYVEGRPIVNHWSEMHEIPASTPLSDMINKELKRRGFSFVGSTIIYAYMQSIGMVNDHLTSCFCHSRNS